MRQVIIYKQSPDATRRQVLFQQTFEEDWGASLEGDVVQFYNGASRWSLYKAYKLGLGEFVEFIDLPNPMEQGEYLKVAELD